MGENPLLWFGDCEPAFWYDGAMAGKQQRRGRRSGSQQRAEEMPGTYQTRIASYAGRDRHDGDAALYAYADRFGMIQRELFAAVMSGQSAAGQKNGYVSGYGIPARMFNAVRVSLDGKLTSVREQMQLRHVALENRVARGERVLAEALDSGDKFAVHRKRRRLADLRRRLAGLGDDIAAGKVRLCFGSKRLWRKQHHLKANGYGSHDDWLQDWQDARSDEFFVLGSRDETAGCQLCVTSVADDGTLTLRLRLPDCLAEQHGKYLTIEGVRFAYGHEQVLAALQSNAEYAAYRREHGRRRLGPPNWVRPSATGSSGTARDGGCL